MQQRPLEEVCTSTTVSVADGIHTELVRIFKAGQGTGHHAHVYDHTTVIVRGAVEAWGGGALLGVYREMDSLLIRAGVKHRFLALEDDTTFVCVHNIGRTGAIEAAAPFTAKDIP
jgi:quercetin dioxygenase-like cupin family protein